MSMAHIQVTDILATVSLLEKSHFHII